MSYSFHNIYYVESKEQIAAIVRRERYYDNVLNTPTKTKVAYPEKYPSIMCEKIDGSIRIIQEIGFDNAMKALEWAAQVYHNIIDTEADDEEVGTAVEVLKSLRNFQGFLFGAFPKEHERWLAKK